MTELEVHALNTASLTFPYTPIVDLDLGSFTSPVPVYVIDHPEGVVLMDTGINLGLIDDPVAYGAPQLAGMVGGAEVTDPQTPMDAMAGVGYDPEDVDYVILSHLHFDHTGYIDAFPDAEFIVQRDELQYAWWPNDEQYAFFLPDDFECLRDFDVTAIDGEYDLFGDGSVVCFPTPGHTPGHQSVLLHPESTRPIVVAFDVAYCHEAYEEGLWTSFDWSLETARKSMRAVKQRAAAEGATVSILHDPEDLETLRQQISSEAED